LDRGLVRRLPPTILDAGVDQQTTKPLKDPGHGDVALIGVFALLFDHSQDIVVRNYLTGKDSANSF